MINNFPSFQTGNFLFSRAYTLAIGAPNQTSALQYGNVGKNPSPLRLRFDIDKNSLGTSNKSKIELFNLTAKSRQAIKDGYLLQLKAGYQKNFDQLFLGNIFPNGVFSTRNGPDIITAMECGDGESAIVMARLDQSYPPGVSALQIVKDCAVAMHTENEFNPNGVGSGIILGLQNIIYSNGLTVKGAVADTLNFLLKKQGLEWSVQNGNLTIIPKTGHNGQTAIVVSSSTGMIGVPSGNRQIMKFNALLNPKLIPGALIKMVSENTDINGFYCIKRSHFEGDTHDNKWQVECECREQTNIVQDLPNAGLLSPVDNLA